MLETSMLGLGQDLGLLSVLRFMQWLAGYRFSCCDFNLVRTDLKSAIGSRVIWLVWHESSISPEIIFKPTKSARPKFRIFFYSALLSLCRMFEDHLFLGRMIRVCLFKTADAFVWANRRAWCKYSLRILWSRLVSCSYSLDSNFSDVLLLFWRLYIRF